MSFAARAASVMALTGALSVVGAWWSTSEGPRERALEALARRSVARPTVLRLDGWMEPAAHGAEPFSAVVEVTSGATTHFSGPGFSAVSDGRWTRVRAFETPRLPTERATRGRPSDGLWSVLTRLDTLAADHAVSLLRHDVGGTWLAVRPHSPSVAWTETRLVVRPGGEVEAVEVIDGLGGTLSATVSTAPGPTSPGR